MLCDFVEKSCMIIRKIARLPPADKDFSGTHSMSHARLNFNMLLCVDIQ